MCSTMIVCVLIPRFELAVAAGGREALAAGPVALAPEAGTEQRIGEASAAAEAYGVRAGLRLGEALARCPTLRLVAPDPAGVADEWDRLLGALEGIGAAVEPGRPGAAWFDARGLRTIHGGLEGVITAARRALAGSATGATAPGPRRAVAGPATGAAAPGPRRAVAGPATGAAAPGPRRALAAPARIGAAPSRFAALAAATRARPRRAEIAPEGPGRLAAYLAPLPVSLLAAREETAVLPETLERFGVRTLGELARMPRDALADRFGAAGPLARDLARGRDTPLRPRRVAERLEERLDLPESASGPQLQRALGLLVDRLLARRERRGRTLRRVVLVAELVEGGTWRTAVTFREALADPRRMRLVLVPRLDELPAPATALRLRAEGLGPPTGDQRSLLAEPAAVRAARLREAVRQARAVAGPDAALRILPVDPDSRVPERRLALAPWEP
jgi:nucleotidyltransferase/DNA polymerase involved in DNA repair